MPSPKAKDIPKIIENSAQIMEDMIRALFFGILISIYSLCYNARKNVSTLKDAKEKGLNNG